MLLRPPKTVTELISSVGCDDSRVWAKLPEKCDLFRRLAKNRGLRWNYAVNKWLREAGANNSPRHLAAELAHVLLAAGFPVEIDDEIAQMVMDVSYEPEKRLRVAAYKLDPYCDWLAIVWPPDLDHYRQAWALPSSRYAKPHVVVPPDYYEAVLDFAEEHGFWITPAAQKIIDAAAERKRSALIVAVPPLPAAPTAPQREDGIDPELADDDEPL